VDTGREKPRARQPQAEACLSSPDSAKRRTGRKPVAERLLSSLTGLTIQWVAIVLVAILLAVLRRSVQRVFLHYWALSHGCLAIGLLALWLAFLLPAAGGFLYPVYLFAEYAWVYTLLAGCRNLANGTQPGRNELYLAPLGMVLALGLPLLGLDFNTLFAIHAGILAAFFIMSFVVLCASSERAHHGAGMWVMVVALLLLAAVFLHYVPLCAYAGLTGEIHHFPHLQHSSIYDMLLEILLAFGIVMVAMDSVRRELEKTNYDLAAASLRLQAMAQEDSLTESYNRHAFYSWVERQRVGYSTAFPGSVALIDVNDLKVINDQLGHPAGDQVIRAVARTIRTVIRADDLLFRWGGDEFLILWPKVSEEDARERLSRLNPMLAETLLPGISDFVRVSVAVGVASIASIRNLEQAIHNADGEMYAHKQALKNASDSEVELAL
jgi:diguanylate cyclase (GGDEF)-like protein